MEQDLKPGVARWTAGLRGRAALAALCCTVLLTWADMAHSASKRVALLVGVGAYEFLAQGAQLGGPSSDVTALKDVLQRRWGFAPRDIHTLVDKQASWGAIMSELRALKQRSEPGDEVLVYFSGHGTSALDANFSGNLEVPLPHGSGAFVPADFRFESDKPLKERLVIGREHLVGIFQDLERGGRTLWVISDSCYSGQQVRSVLIPDSTELPSRMLPMKVNESSAHQRADLALVVAAGEQALRPYPYTATAFLSASSEGERARDISGPALPRYPTLDGKPHGALTDALLRVLEGQLPADLNGDGYLSLSEVHRSTSDFMAQRAYGHTPQRLPAVSEDSQGLGNRPVLTVRNMVARPTRGVLQPLKLREDNVPLELKQSIARLPDVQWVGKAEPADIILAANTKFVSVLSPAGDLLSALPLTAAEKALAQVRQLAWAKRLRTLAEIHRRGALAADVDPAAFGGNFPIGSKVAFVVRPDRAATLVLVSVNADGKVTVLYPYSPAEARPLQAQQATFIPGQGPQERILVTEPVGMDMQLIFAFDEPPPELAKLHYLREVDPEDVRLAALERSVQSLTGKFTFAATNLRTLRP